MKWSIKYLYFGIAFCIIAFSLNFVGFEIRNYVNSALSTACSSITEDEQLCSNCDCNLKKVNCEFKCPDCNKGLPDLQINEHKRQTRDSPSSVVNWETKVNCIRASDQSDICIYENICMNTESLVFLSNEVTKNTTLAAVGIDNTIWEPRFMYPHPYPHPKAQFLPTGSQNLLTRSKIVHSKSLNAKDIIMHKEEVVWMVDFETPNIEKKPYLFAKNTLNLFEATMLNETTPNPLFPPMDSVLLFIEWLPAGWISDFYKTVIQDQTKTMLFPEIKLMGINANNLLCFPKAVIVGDKPNLFSGIYHFQQFKERVFQKVELPIESGIQKIIFNTKYESPLQLVFSNLRSDGKSPFYNHQEMSDIFNLYALNITEVGKKFDWSNSLRSHIELIHSADVYICEHGEYSINLIFLPVHTTIIEIFPMGIKNKCYERISFPAGIHYQAVRTWLKPPKDVAPLLHSNSYLINCQNDTYIAQSSQCIEWSKSSPIFVPMAELENSLIEAFDTQGYLLPIRSAVSYRESHDIPLNDWHSAINW